MKGIKPSFAYALFWLILSTVLLTLPGSAFPKENWLSKIWFDKWVHIVMFFIMVVLWCWFASEIWGGQKKLLQYFILIALVFTSYGVVMELVQQNLVSNRSFDSGDIIADAVGCIAGLLFSRWKFISRQSLN